MARRLVVRGEEAEITVELGEGAVAKELWSRLPIDSKARLRGEEIHFPILAPDAVEPADRSELDVGDVAYWPPENALCLFFDHTTGKTPRTAEDFTKVGWIVEGLEDCKHIRANETLRIEALEHK